MNIVNTILSFILGADYEILRLCPTEYAKQKKRIIAATIVAVVSCYASTFLFRDYTAVSIGATSLLLYITYLCKNNTPTFTKFILALSISVFIFYCFSRPAFGGILRLTPNNINAHFIAWPLAVVCLIGCFLPVNFNETNSDYAILHQKKIDDAIAKGTLLLEEKHKSDKEIIHNREEVRVKMEQKLAEYASAKIYESQKKIIDLLAEKWLNETQSEVIKNTEAFIGSNSVRTIGIKRNIQEELDKYISERLKEKRLEFAEIIINKWAEEKKKEILTNSTKFVS